MANDSGFAATTDPQTAADAAEDYIARAIAMLREWFVIAEPSDDDEATIDVPAVVIDAAVAALEQAADDRARLAAELEQVRGQRDRQQQSAAFWRRRAFQLADLIPAEQIPDPEWDDSDESQLAERNEQLRNAVTEAARLLARLSGPGPCDVDPDGACRGHAGFASGYLEPCPHPAGRRFAETWGTRQGDAQPPVGPQDAPQGP